MKCLPSPRASRNWHTFRSDKHSSWRDSTSPVTEGNSVASCGTDWDVVDGYGEGVATSRWASEVTAAVSRVEGHVTFCRSLHLNQCPSIQPPLHLGAGVSCHIHWQCQRLSNFHEVDCLITTSVQVWGEPSDPSDHWRVWKSRWLFQHVLKFFISSCICRREIPFQFHVTSFNT